MKSNVYVGPSLRRNEALKCARRGGLADYF